MVAFSRYRYLILASASAIGGAAVYSYTLYNSNVKSEHLHSDKSISKTTWTSEFAPSIKWDSNWDRRDPKSLVKPMKIRDEADENKYNEQILCNKPKAIRHLILIRHGQYNLAGETDSERTLTELGRQQADYTGKRLAELKLPYDLIVRSTMTRAQETSKIIEKHLNNVTAIDDSILIEGSPIPPEPSFGRWTPDAHYFQSGARIEAAFRKYFYRADPKQDKDSYTVLVCHSNVIRYFVCRALQFPPEAWLRFSLKNGSITWVSIHPSGRVLLRTFGDTGYMPTSSLTTT